MEPSNSQPPQPSQVPNPSQQPQVITPQQQAAPESAVPVGGASQMPGSVAAPVQGPTQAPVSSAYPQQNWQQPGQPAMQPSQGMTPPPSGSKKKTWLVIAALLAGVAVLAAGAFFFVDKSKNNTPDASKVAQQSSQSAGAQTKEMSTLQGLTFVAPADMSAFTPKSVTGEKNIYATKDSTDAKTCSLSFGIYSATELPGADINEILKPQLENLKKTGVTVQGPTAGEPLVVKDASGTSYSMPSLTFDLTKGTQHETDHYSISVLGNGKRAVVQRSCANKNGVVDPGAFSVLESTAQKVTIKAD